MKCKHGWNADCPWCAAEKATPTVTASGAMVWNVRDILFSPYCWQHRTYIRSEQAVITETLRRSIRSFAIEVEIEAARLIERGVPPYSAVDQARAIVCERRLAQSNPDSAGEKHD